MAPRTRKSDKARKLNKQAKETMFATLPRRSNIQVQETQSCDATKFEYKADEQLVSAKVFDTYELLEMILYELSTKDLLLSQRVSKLWKAVVDSSAKLQQALFFQPIPGGPLGPGSSGLSEFRALKNPLLTRIFQNFDRFGSEGFQSDNIEGSLGPPDLWGPGPRPEEIVWRGESASWRRMQPCQPPIRNCFFAECNWFDDLKDCHSVSSFSPWAPCWRTLAGSYSAYPATNIKLLLGRIFVSSLVLISLLTMRWVGYLHGLSKVLSISWSLQLRGATARL